MEGTRAPQGLDAEDRLAFGLTASHLSYLLVGSLAGYALFAGHLPGFIKYPLGALCVAAGVLLAWGRIAHRPLDVWMWLALRYYLRPRRSPSRLEAPAEEILHATPGRASAIQVAVDAAEDAEREPLPDSVAAADDNGADTHILTLPPRLAGAGDGERDDQVLPEHLPEAAPVFMAPTQRVAFFSLKGGVGKTTLATEVATLLAVAAFTVSSRTLRHCAFESPCWMSTSARPTSP